MDTKKKIAALREEMKKEKIGVYIIPTSDFHNSEYVSPYFMTREYFSGFTGSAGTLVVTESEAALFTDGRYFIQAENQLQGSGIVLMRSGESGVPTVRKYVLDTLPESENIGFDGRVLTAETGRYYKKNTGEKNVGIVDIDLADRIWKDRPALEHTEIYLLDEKYSGKSAAEKLSEVREKMSEKKADVHIITALDEISWLFNIRADDIKCCPMVLSYAAVTESSALLFADTNACGEKVLEYLGKNGITLRPYDEIYSYAEKLSAGSVWIDKKERISVLRKL